MREQDLQTRIIKDLPAGCWGVKIMSANRNGCPDVLVCWRGKFVAIEVKKKGKKPTRMQAHQHESIQAAGGVAAVVDDWAGWLELKKSLLASD